MFCDTAKYKHAWVDFQAKHQPRADILLHVNSATIISKAYITWFFCKGFTSFTHEKYKIPKAQSITEIVYHPSGLYPHKKIKPWLILPFVFSPTWFPKILTTLVEQYSIWDISTALVKILSKLQSIELWNILQHPITLLQDKGKEISDRQEVRWLDKSLDKSDLKYQKKVDERIKEDKGKVGVVKADGAEIPDHSRISLPDYWEDKVAFLRKYILRWWRRRVAQSFGKHKKLLKGKQAITNYGVRWDYQTTFYKWIIEPNKKGWKCESEYERA